ncbi:MAG: four helix bundle protein [Caldilineaceae bacterium]|nr:four helix bundle protein [Caldilineaceae bacterium]MCB0142812.1 four helix bundle protein [Caldilineaceae bacterium]
MDYRSWLEQIPTEIKDDALWRMEVYRLALFVGDLAWHDAQKLLRNRITRDLADQLYRAAAGISPNIGEGYSRASSRDQARFYEYGLGSSREARDWYFKGRHVLTPEVIHHRIKLHTEIARHLTRMIQTHRAKPIKEAPQLYYPETESELMKNIPFSPNLDLQTVQ